jgi:hypothetical protein
MDAPLSRRQAFLKAAACVVMMGAEPAAENRPGTCLSLEQLAHLSCCELEQLYRQGKVGPIPCGFVHGRAIYCPCTKGAAAKSCISKLMWRGKQFDSCGMINVWRGGLHAIRAEVYEGCSWLDGKPATFLDYSRTSRVWADVHDEFREVAPGLYLGMMYRGDCCPEFKTFFALEVSCCR